MVLIKSGIRILKPNTVLTALSFLLLFVTQIHAAEGDLVWRQALTGGYIASSPALGANGTIYISASDGGVYALSPAGTVDWVYTSGGSVDDSPAIGPNGDIYFGSFDHAIYALDSTGRSKWRYETGDIIRSTPAVSRDGTIFIGSGDGNIYALNSDGSLLWRYKTGDAVHSSPAIGFDGTVYAGSRDGHLYAISSDGRLLWKHMTDHVIHWSSPAIGSDGTVYVGSWDGSLYAVNTDGTLRWKYNTGDMIGSSPAIGSDGTVYVESCDSYLYAINPDGTLRWKFLVGNTRFGCHPLVGRDGTVYVGSSDGNMYAVNADGSLRWSYPTGREILTSGPVIASNGILYFVSMNGNMYAVDTGTGEGLCDSSWPRFHGDIRNSGTSELVVIDPLLLTIRDVSAGGSGTGVITVSNYSTEVITLESITIDDETFTAVLDNHVIQPSATATITVTFAPDEADEHRATMNISIDGRQYAVRLHGNPPAEPQPVRLRIVTTDTGSGSPLPCRIYLVDEHGMYYLLDSGETSKTENRMFITSPGDVELSVLSGDYTLSIARGNEYIPIHDEAISILANSDTYVIERTLERWVHMKEYGWYSCDNQVNNYDGREPELLYPYQRAEDLNIMHLICLGSYSFTPNYEFFRHGVFPFSEPFYPCVIGEEWRSRTWQNHMIIMNHSAPLSQWGNGFYDGESPYQYSYPPAMDFCDETHDLGGVVLGTHPFWYDPFTEMTSEGVNRNLAFELPADIALGKMDGMQIYMYWGFDQWNRYVWYRLMNCGFKIAPFAGTDALLNKRSFVRKGVMEPLAGQVRSYAYVPDQEDALDYDEWIEASVEGRSFISAGPVMFFSVNGEIPGSTISLQSTGGSTTITAEVDARWIGGLDRIDFIVNGETVSERDVNGTEAVESISIEIDESSWIACHVQGRRFDEFEGIAHSGAIYIELDDRPIHSTEDAQYFVEWIDKHIAVLDSAGHFEFDWQKERTFNLYREAQDVFENLASGNISAVTEGSPLPFRMNPASPNPFNAHTTLSFTLPDTGMTEIEVYNTVGQCVCNLLSDEMQAGTHRVVWNGRDDDGNEVSTGVYVCRLKFGNLVRHSKLMLIR